MKLLLSTALIFILISFSAFSAFSTKEYAAAPEIALPTPDGSVKKLSDLRGKVVLVDFWASWCKTCRRENVNLVAAYNKYKDESFKGGEGFEIYSVSLDYDKEQWANAIKNDGMTWENQVSDLKKWESSVVEPYHVRFLPHNVLLDENGEVLASRLFGSKLDAKLAELVK